MDIIDLRMEQREDGVFDLVIGDGGLLLDETLETSIAATLFTDSYSSDKYFGERRGGLGIYFGNNAWTKLLHARSDDEEVNTFVNNSYSEALNEDFIENDVFNLTEINIQYIMGNFYINISGYNSVTSENKFNYNYKISGMNNG